MHMKACGNVYICRCGIRLCSLGALKRHCKQFAHEPESLEPKPENALAILADPSAPAWGVATDALPGPYVAMVAEQQQHQLALHQHAAAAAAAAMADYGARVVGAGVDPSVAMAGIPGVVGVPGVVTGMGDMAGVPSLLGAQALAGGLPL